MCGRWTLGPPPPEEEDGGEPVRGRHRRSLARSRADG